jgi:hypothetical protein
MTTTSTLRAFALALVSALVFPATASAAQPAHPKVMPTPRLPSTPLHTEFKVEVNRKGQIVRVKSGKECKNPTFNAMTYGNVLQMFIRRPDGSATVGMYRVTFDYSPKTQKVDRHVALLSEGGDWADEQGAVDQMREVDRKNQQNHLGLPGFDKVFKATPKPTKHP